MQTLLQSLREYKSPAFCCIADYDRYALLKDGCLHVNGCFVGLFAWVSDDGRMVTGPIRSHIRTKLRFIFPNTPGVPGPFRDMFPACLADEIFLPTLDPALYVQCVFPSHQWGKWMLSSDHEASFSVERP